MKILNSLAAIRALKTGRSHKSEQVNLITQKAFPSRTTIVRLLPGLFGLLVILFLVSSRFRTPAPLRTGGVFQRDYWPTAGWRTDSPEKQGMNAQALDGLDLFIERELPHVTSVLVVRHGYLVFEEYYQGYHADLAVDVTSVTKSITSALVGIALREGYMKSLDQSMKEFFPEYVGVTSDPRTQDVTLEQLLTMTANVAWSEEKQWRWPSGREWMRAILNTQLESKASGKFTYFTPGVHLLSGVLAKSTGMSTLAFAEKHLFSPLGISTLYWEADPQGYQNGGRGLYFTGHHEIMIPLLAAMVKAKLEKKRIRRRK